MSQEKLHFNILIIKKVNYYHLLSSIPSLMCILSTLLFIHDQTIYVCFFMLQSQDNCIPYLSCTSFFTMSDSYTPKVFLNRFISNFLTYNLFSSYYTSVPLACIFLCFTARSTSLTRYKHLYTLDAILE